MTEDDELLIELKEDRGLVWKQFGQYFPKGSSGLLQVLYSTRVESRCGASNDLSATGV